MSETTTDERTAGASADELGLLDPLMSMRKTVSVLLFANGAIGVVLAFLALAQPGPMAFLQVLPSVAGCLVLAGLLKHVLPDGPPDVLLLRSFKLDTDRDSRQLKRILETAAYPLRIAGVREPGKRILPVLRPLLDTVFIWIYALNRRMNLEAGGDWRERLLHSMARTNSVVVDYRSATPFVTEELRLALTQVGARRLCVIADDKTVDDKVLGACRAAGATILEWSADPAKQERLAVAWVSFLSVVPAPVQSVPPDLLHEVRQLQAKERDLVLDVPDDQRAVLGGWLLAGLLVAGLAMTDRDSLIGGSLLVVQVLIGLIGTVAAAIWMLENRARRHLHSRLPDPLSVGGMPQPYFLSMALAMVFAMVTGAGALIWNVSNEYEERQMQAEFFTPRIASIANGFEDFYDRRDRLPTSSEVQDLLKELPTSDALEVVDASRVRISAPAAAPRGLRGKQLTVIHELDGSRLRRTCLFGDDAALADSMKWQCEARRDP